VQLFLVDKIIVYEKYRSIRRNSQDDHRCSNCQSCSSNKYVGHQTKYIFKTIDH